MTGVMEWNEAWKDALRRSTWWKRENERAAYWNDETTGKYYESMKGIARIGQIVAALELDASTTVLDIGSGPGIIAIPAAKISRLVTAVDPAPAMLSCLKRNADAENLTNVEYVNKKWEDVVPYEDVAPHDVLIASYSLAMLDMRAALSKMDSLALRSVHLVMGAGNAMDPYRDLWLDLHEEEFNSGPGYIYVYNILHDMGIYANVEISKVEFPHSYASLDEALERWKKMFHVSTARGEKILRSRLPAMLHENDGLLWWTRTEKSARIWWHKS